MGGLTLELAAVWTGNGDSEDSTLTFFLELPQAAPSSSASAVSKGFYPNVGFIMGFVRRPRNVDVMCVCVCVRARVCVWCCVHSPCCDQEPTNHDAPIERFSLTVSDLECLRSMT